MIRQLLAAGPGDVIGNPTVPNGFVVPTDADSRIAGFFSMIFVISSILAVLFVMKGGLDYIMSSGDAGKVKTAQAEIQYALMGLIISLVGFVIVSVVTNLLGYNAPTTLGL